MFACIHNSVVGSTLMTHAMLLKVLLLCLTVGVQRGGAGQGQGHETDVAGQGHGTEGVDQGKLASGMLLVIGDLIHCL